MMGKWNRSCIWSSCNYDIACVISSEILSFPETLLSIFFLSHWHLHLLFFPFFFWENNVMEIIHFRKLFSWHSLNFLPERKRKCEFLVILLASGGLPFINHVEKVYCFYSLKGNISKAFSPAIIIVLFIVIQSLFWIIIFKKDNILILRCYPITSMKISVIVKKSFIVWILFFNLIIQIHLTLYFFYIYIYKISNYISTGAIAPVMPPWV